MADKTVYPFGQDGRLPSGYPIADDLVTDSAQQSLSARQGKMIGDYLDGKVGGRFVKIDLSLQTLHNYSLGANTIDKNRWTNTQAKHLAIPVTPGDIYSLSVTGGTASSGIYGLFTDYVAPTEKASSVYYRTGEGRIFKTKGEAPTILTIPDGVYYLILCTVDGTNLTAVWDLQKKTFPKISDDLLAIDSIVDDLTSGGHNSPLSAEMGKTLAEGLAETNAAANKVSIPEEVELPSSTVSFMITDAGKWQAKGKHKAVEVTPGSKIRFKVVESTGGGNWYAFLTSSYTNTPTAGDDVPFAGGETSRKGASAAHGWYVYDVPNDAAYLYLIVVDGTNNTTEWEVETLTIMGTSEAFEQYVFAEEGDPSDIYTKYDYDGPLVKVKERHKVAPVQVSTVTSQEFQGGACYGDYLFMFTEGNGTCWMYNLLTGTLVQEITIPSAQRGFVSTCHCNTVNFGPDKYDSGDPFPLIYVSTGYASGGYTGALVYRIVATTENNTTTYSLSLVQTIKMPGTGWTEFVVGEENDCYLFYTSVGKCYRKVLPSLSAGEEVIMDLENSILAEYNFTANPSWFDGSRGQNRMYHNGKIYMTSGVPNAYEKCLFIVLDLATGTREVVIDLKNNLGLTSEPEACFIWQGHICIAFRSNTKIYALYFFE